MPVGITIGFDLDMTLIDSRAGMAEAMNRLGAESGLALDGAHFAANLGPPLDTVLLGMGAPPDRVPALVDRFRAMYPEIVVPGTAALPGAAAAFAAVHALPGRTVVITGKYAPNAALHLKQLGLDADVLVGELWAGEKAAALTENGASVYVGDHIGDMQGARKAGVIAVGVTTGPCDRADLEHAGADVVLAGLDEFPGWLAENRARLG